MDKNHHPDNIQLQQIQDELDASRQILKAIFDSTKSSIFLVAPDYRILFFNKWARDGCKLLYGRDMFIGDSILNYREEDDDLVERDFKSAFEDAILKNEFVVREREMHHPTMHFWVRQEYTPVYEGEELIGVLVNVQNISDKKKFELQSERQGNELVRIAWSQSHETRQPVATMLGLINILDKKTLTEDNLEIVKLLQGTAEKLDKIIQRIVVRANEVSGIE